ncbi:MAG: hypothetical protein IKO19_12990 [Candidatus Riflebacteria bacterium]|nr:hypothetical protein [Candidatus Riflebacteria bacterium]MBR4571567.1 hypothetical protein [Candidatus Riflebacteria bacterium]
MNKISRKANHGLSLCLLLFVVFIFSSADAMIRDISLNELIKRSDVVAVVDILAVKSVGTLPSGAQVIANLVKVNEPLKGNVAIGEKLKLKTRTIEDNASFKKGQKTLLFLKRVNNYYEVVSGILGSWPIEDDGSLYGYGTGNNISDVKKAIETIESQKKEDSEEESKSDSKIVISI